jgi:hypothetical protein
MDRTQILLAEYAEAAAICRAHEQNTRTALSIFIVLAAGLISLAFTGAISNAGKVWLFFLGFGTGVFLLNTVFRHRAYYSSYVHRAKEIEKELGMTLYTQAWDDVRSSRTFSNKHAIAGLLGLLCAFFLVGAFMFAFRGLQ